MDTSQSDSVVDTKPDANTTPEQTPGPADAEHEPSDEPEGTLEPHANEADIRIDAAQPTQVDEPTNLPDSEHAETGEGKTQDNTTSSEGHGFSTLMKRHWKALAIAVGVVVSLVVLAITWFNLTFGNVPEVNGKTPGQASAEIQSVSNSWKVEYTSSDDIQALSADELEQKYEVTSVEPAAGTRLKRGDSNVITLTLEKNEETVKAEKRQAIIQSEIDRSLENGWASETYEDLGDVVVYKAVSDQAALSSNELHLDLDYSYAVKKDENPDYIDENIAYFNSLAEQLQSNVICLQYTSDGYLISIYYGEYSGASRESIEKAAKIAADARDKHIAKIADNLEPLLNGILANFHDLGKEYTVKNGKLSLYIYGAGFGRMEEGGRVVEDLSYSSAKVEHELWIAASDYARFLQMPVTINFIKNDALFASSTVEPEDLLMQ